MAEYDVKTALTELDRFAEIDVSVAGILAAENAAQTLYIYPDEVAGRDGETVDQVTHLGARRLHIIGFDDEIRALALFGIR